MSNDTEHDDDGRDKTAPDTRLFNWYREYIGEPEAESDVYIGFGLFFGGIGFGTLALVFFVISTGFTAGTGPFWAWRSGAFSLGMLSLPVALVSVVVLLPVQRRAVYSAVGGGVVCLAAVVGFLAVYPAKFNVLTGPDYSVHVVVTYALGMAAVVASTGSALVAHHLSQAAPDPRKVAREHEQADTADADEGESWSDEDIQNDIDSAMEDVEITWGGVEKDEGSSLNVNFGEDIETADVNFNADTVRRESTDDQVAGLRQLKGGETQTETSESTVDDQTQKLQQLKQQQRQKQQTEQEQAAAVTAERGLLARILDMLSLR